MSGLKKTLVSFLGKTKDDKNYQETTYRMPDSTRTFKTRFLGINLARELKCDRLLLLGTETSMWDNLILEYLQEEGLLDSFEGKDLSEKLSLVQEILGKTLGMEVTAQIIPMGKNEQEQLEILGIMASNIQSLDEVFIDVTHGFRHLSMLSILVASYLEVVNKIRVKSFYYGAFDMMEDKICPIISLSGYSKLLSWIRALESFDASGNIGVFASLYKDEGVDSRTLADAGFYERTNQVREARNKISTFRQQDKEIESRSPLLKLFHPILERRTNWYRKTKRSEYELDLAKSYRKKGDWTRAVIYFLEGYYSREIEKAGQNPDNYETRSLMKEDLKRGEDKDPKLYTLACIRNVVAHTKFESRGTPHDKIVERYLSSEEKLASFLRELTNSLLKEE